ncbi:MAG: M48 family metallopeptidase [Clostridiales bacterium]
MDKKIFKNIISSDYEHPYDKKALKILKKTPGIDLIVKKFWELGIEKILKIQYTGSHIRVTKNNLPELYKTYIQTCEILDMNKIPDLYLIMNYNINAFTTGVNNPIVILNTSCLDLLNESELRFIIGHELGHIKSGHVLYHQIANILPHIGNMVGNATFGIGNLLSIGLRIAILNWKRMAEFSSDRAGLLACQDINSAINTMVKISGLPTKYYSKEIVEDFLKQAKEFEDLDYDNLSRLTKYFIAIEMSHPWTVLRGSEFIKWTETGRYDEILKTDFDKRQILDMNYNQCPFCNTEITKSYKFCVKCGRKIKNIS